jgi:hypothetical protein
VKTKNVKQKKVTFYFKPIEKADPALSLVEDFDTNTEQAVEDEVTEDNSIISDQTEMEPDSPDHANAAREDIKAEDIFVNGDHQMEQSHDEVVEIDYYDQLADDDQLTDDDSSDTNTEKSDLCGWASP